MALLVAEIRTVVISSGDSAKLVAVCRNHQAIRPQDCDVDCMSDGVHCAMHCTDSARVGARKRALTAALHIIQRDLHAMEGHAMPCKCRVVPCNAMQCSWSFFR